MTDRTARVKWARDTMRSHGLSGWRFVINSRAKRRAGLCNYATQTIEVADFMLDNAADAMFINTVTHEIAHALCGHGAGHGPVWQRTHRALGGDGRRTVRLPADVRPALPWVGVCPGCGAETGAARMGRRMRDGHVACSTCCHEHNFGRYDRRFAFVWRRAA